MFLGLHFVACLLLYDTFLSYVLLVHASLLADLTLDAHERTDCNLWSSFFSILGSCSVFFSNLYWDATDLLSFRIFCVIVAMLSLGSLQLSYRMLCRLPAVSDGERIRLSKVDPITATVEDFSWKGFARDIVKHNNFWIFAVINLLQVFNCHYNSNFLAVSFETFVSPDVSPAAISMMLAFAATFPHVVVVAIAPALRKFGLYRMMQLLYLLKILISAVAFGSLQPGQSSVSSFCAFFLANKIMTETICRHGNLVVAELSDQDCHRNSRANSRSSMYFGAIALFSKPGQAIAAMIGWKALDNEYYFFVALTLVPCICGILQVLLWRKFTFSSSKYEEVHEIKIL